MSRSRNKRKSQLSNHSEVYKEHQRRKDRDMYDRFTKLSGKKMHGAQMLTTEAILAQLEQEFYLDQLTIMRRIKRFAQNKDKDPKQLAIELPI